jgi:hypothetical protein
LSNKGHPRGWPLLREGNGISNAVSYDEVRESKKAHEHPEIIHSRNEVDGTKGIKNPFSLLAKWWILGHDEGVDGAVFARE